MNMRRTAAKFVPHLFNNDQRDHQVQVRTNLQKQLDLFLTSCPGSYLVMNHGWIIMTRKQSSSLRNGRHRPLRDWKKRAKFTATSSSPWLKKVCQVRSNIKSMLIIFLTFEELCIRSLFQPGKTVNGKFYCKVLRQLRKNVRRSLRFLRKNVRRSLRFGRTETGCCTMTMRLHTPCSLWGNSWQKIKWPLFPHPAYTPDLAPCNFLLTPWCSVLLEKLTGLQLVKKLSFHGTRRFITALKSAPHLSLSWVSPIQSIYPHPTSWRSILILSTHLRLGLPSGLLPSGFPTKILYTKIML